MTGQRSKNPPSQSPPSRHPPKVPPHSIEAEESLLVAILLDNETLYEVAEILSPDYFYKPAHQTIFQAIITLFNRNEPVDLVTVLHQLQQDGKVPEIGGADYLSHLLDTVPIAVNATHYARIIRDTHSLRHLIKCSGTISEKCFLNTGDIDEVIDFAEQSIFEISQNKVRQAFTPIGQIVEKNIDTLEERQGNQALVTGVPTGFSRLDQMTSGLQKSDLIILAARPSMGKTALALNIARNAALGAQVPVALFSLEMSQEQLSMRLLCAEARVDSARLRNGYFSKDDWLRLTDAAGSFSDAPIFIDDSANISVMEIRAKSRRLKMDKGLGLIVIDYIQLMRGRADAERRDLAISEISRSLKGLAKELDVPVLALSQLNRMLEQRADKRPMLSDLRESGSLEQDADVVAFIYRDEVYNKEENNPNKGLAEIIIGKQRNGPTGTAHLTFLNEYTRFEDKASDDYLDIE